MRQETSSQQQDARNQSASSDTQRSIPASEEGGRRGNQSAVRRSGGQDGRGRALQLGSSLLPTPWTLMRRLSEELEQLVDSGAATRADIRAPAMEVIQRPDAIVVRADLPGSRPDDIEVTVQHNVLTISGERRQESQQENDGVVRSEVTYGSFARSIVLPDSADPENIKATFRDGVLEVSVPVAGDRDRGKRIDVQADHGSAGRES